MLKKYLFKKENTISVISESYISELRMYKRIKGPSFRALKNLGK